MKLGIIMTHSRSLSLTLVCTLPTQAVRARLDASLAGKPFIEPSSARQPAQFADAYDVDVAKMKEMFDSIDSDKSGKIDFPEFCVAMKKLGVAPKKLD